MGIILKESVRYHARMATLLYAPTQCVMSARVTQCAYLADVVHRKQIGNFQLQLFNPPDSGLPKQYGVAEMGHNIIDEELQSLHHNLHPCLPCGVVPLATHLRDIYMRVSIMADSLQMQGKKFVACLATDGLSTDEWDALTD